MGDLRKERKDFFFEKKKQKTFIPYVPRRASTRAFGVTGPEQKFFGSFFQKRTFLT
jgi:hypothetical protein